MTAISSTRLAGPQPLQYRTLAVLVGLLAAAVMCAALAMWEWRAGVAVAGVAAAGWAFAKPRYGLYTVLAAVVIIEGNSAYAFVRPLADIYRGLDNLLNMEFLPFSPLEIGIMVILLGAIRQSTSVGFRYGPSFAPMIAVAAIFLVGLARGMETGADGMQGLREIRAVLYLPPLYLASANLIRTREHIRQLTIVLIAAITFMSVGALHTHFTEVRTGQFTGSLDLLFSHENAIFGGLLVVFLTASIVWAKDNRTRLILAIPAVIALAAVMIMKRRIGIIALDTGLLLVALAVFKTNIRLSLILLPFVVALGVVYLGMYWDQTGGLGQGARSFRTVVGQESTAEDKSSEDYRDIEAFNVRENISWQPVWGTGFGHEYQFVRPLPDLTGFWPMQRYIPHNTILWSWMKGGILALVLVLALFGHSLMKGMGLIRKQSDPLLRSWAIAATAAVLMTFLFAWWDLGLVSLRVMTVFGMCLGILAALSLLSEAEPAAGARSNGDSNSAPGPAI